MKTTTKIVTLGKDVLKKGFSYNTKWMTAEDIKFGLRTVFGLTELGIISTAITPSSEVDFYIPSVVRYATATKELLDPWHIFKHCCIGDDMFRPSADFVIFEKWDNVACITFTKDAPVIVFESKKNGTICLGTILRSAIKDQKIFSRVIKKIKLALNFTLDDPEISAKLVVCTDYNYPDTGNLIDLLTELMDKENITLLTDDVIIPSKEPDKYFTREDKGNNLIVVY